MTKALLIVVACVAAILCAGTAYALSNANAIESANVITLASTPTELVADVRGSDGRVLRFQSYDCVVTVATAALGVYVVDPGDANTSDGFGPFCTSSSECPLGPRIVGDSQRVYLLAASGTPNVACRMGHL